MSLCYVCKTETVEPLFDFGPMPVCNRFLHSPDEPEVMFRFVLCQCRRCGLVQVSDPVPPHELRPCFNWISYNEPSAHLPELVKRIARLPYVSAKSIVCGIFLPNDPTLRIFNEQGFQGTWRLDLKEDLRVLNDCAGTETIQEKVDVSTVETLKANRGQPNVLVVRHILEHAHNISRLLAGLKSFVESTGYVVFEVPDCEPAFEKGDYTILWEEHVCYFTKATFLNCLREHGFEPVHFEQTGVSLVAITRPVLDIKSDCSLHVSDELTRAETFVGRFSKWKGESRQFLREFCNTGGKIALFGAGHLSCTFANLLELRGLVSVIIDDHTNKQRMIMPGCKLPIVSSSVLDTGEIKLCLSSLGINTDRKVIEKHPRFLRDGGKYRSIFPGENFYLEQN